METLGCFVLAGLIGLVLGAMLAIVVLSASDNDDWED